MAPKVAYMELSVVDTEPDPKLFAGSGSVIINFDFGSDKLQFLENKIAFILLNNHRIGTVNFTARTNKFTGTYGRL